jgi:class 3 adenylate cyclase
MQCPNCSHSNLDTANFCENCGRPLPRACPNCGRPVLPGARFCSNCGFPLAETAPAKGGRTGDGQEAAQAGAQAGAQVSAQAAEIAGAAPGLQGRGPIPTTPDGPLPSERTGDERKFVSALFVDIVGSTALAEAMDPEDWREIVAGAHQRVAEAVRRYDGTVAQFLGDGVLAFFGAPIAHEVDAERAIRAGLVIQASIGLYAGELQQRGVTSGFQVRVGLNSGLVVVGKLGDRQHAEYLAVGDAVNLAARLQSAAAPGTILVSESTSRLAGPVFEFEDLGKMSFKGKTAPVQVYRVSGERKGAARVRGVPGVVSPLVGREAELARLTEVSKSVQDGQGSVVSIIGEAGIGKSRLVTEWRRSAEEGLRSGANIRWAEVHCLSYGSAIPHQMIVALLRALIGVSEVAVEDTVSDALRRNLVEALTNEGEEANEIDEVYAFLAHLLGLRLDENLAARIRYLDGRALLAQYVSAGKRFLAGLACRAPTVILCDDVHWADPSSVDLTAELLTVAAGAPLVFVLMSRPDPPAAGWRLITRARALPAITSVEIHLEPLSGADSARSVGNLLNSGTLPESLRTLVLARTDGNPFFVEEVLHMLMEQGALARVEDGSATGRWALTREVQEIEIPETLQGVLAARIDRLAEDAKHVLQVASVIGRRFDMPILERVWEQAS